MGMDFIFTTEATSCMVPWSRRLCRNLEKQAGMSSVRAADLEQGQQSGGTSPHDKDQGEDGDQDDHGEQNQHDHQTQITLIIQVSI